VREKKKGGGGGGESLESKEGPPPFWVPAVGLLSKRRKKEKRNLLPLGRRGRKKSGPISSISNYHHRGKGEKESLSTSVREKRQVGQRGSRTSKF